MEFKKGDRLFINFTELSKTNKKFWVNSVKEYKYILFWYSLSGRTTILCLKENKDSKKEYYMFKDEDMKYFTNKSPIIFNLAKYV